MNQPLIRAIPFKAAEAGIVETRKIVGGDYDFDSNVLILNVEISKVNEATHETKTAFEKRVFEITSLKVKVEGEDGATDIQLLGARTDEAMKQVMPQIIRNFQEYVNADVFLSRDVQGRFIKKSAQFERAKTIGEDLTNVGNVDKIITYSENLEEPGHSGSHVAWKMEDPELENIYTETRLRNTTVLKSLLNYVHWDSMIQRAQSGEASRHEWNPSKLVGTKPHPMLNEILGTLNGKGGAQINLFKEASGRFNRLESIKQQSDQHLQFLRLEKRALEDFIKDNSPLTSDDLHYISIQKDLIEKELSGTHVFHKKLVMTLNLQRDLAVMMAIRGIAKQTASGGQGAIGATLTKDWDHIVSHYNLAPRDMGHVESDDQATHLQDHLAEKLGLKIPLGLDFYQRSQTIRKDVEGAIELIGEKILRSAAELNERKEIEAEFEAELVIRQRHQNVFKQIGEIRLIQEQEEAAVRRVQEEEIERVRLIEEKELAAFMTVAPSRDSKSVVETEGREMDSVRRPSEGHPVSFLYEADDIFSARGERAQVSGKRAERAKRRARAAEVAAQQDAESAAPKVSKKPRLEAPKMFDEISKDKGLFSDVKPATVVAPAPVKQVRQDASRLFELTDDRDPEVIFAASETALQKLGATAQELESLGLKI